MRGRIRLRAKLLFLALVLLVAVGIVFTLRLWRRLIHDCVHACRRP